MYHILYNYLILIANVLILEINQQKKYLENDIFYIVVILTINLTLFFYCS